VILDEILTRRSSYALLKTGKHYGEVVFVGVVCDNCGISVQAASVEQLAPKLSRWYVDPEIGMSRDLCPDCVRRS
jgi:hypothetical protein